MKQLKDCLPNEMIEKFAGDIDSDWRSLDDDNLRLLKMKVNSTWVMALKTDHEDQECWREYMDQIHGEIFKRKNKVLI